MDIWLIIGIPVAIVGVVSIGMVVIWTVKAFRGTLGTDVPDDLKDLF
jgi:hypothetical protein